MTYLITYFTQGGNFAETVEFQKEDLAKTYAEKEAILLGSIRHTVKKTTAPSGRLMKWDNIKGEYEILNG